VILVWGSRADSPVARVLDALSARGADVLHVDASRLASARYDLVFGPAPSGWLEVEGRRVSVEEIASAYVRPGEPASAAGRRASMVFLALAASLPGIVLNPPAAGRSNGAKPYQLGLIARSGFDVPETLVTTDPEAARAFLRRHGRLVYKSLSGIRSIVATLEPGDEARLDGVRTGPVQLQKWIAGLDVRAHVVGERVFACAVRSTAADYRYSGAAAELSAYDLPPAIGERVVALAHEMGLRLAGVDLRLAPDGGWTCFEVNPSPGFPWYEDSTGHPIAAAIAEELAPRPGRRATAVVKTSRKRRNREPEVRT
jgi:glutathione synthase/RimK-type ligase-like ATP-grasp enzyme